MFGSLNRRHAVKPVLSCHSKRRPKIGFQYRLSLNAGQKYCRMLESILQYFRPTLSYHLSLRPLFCLFLSGRLRQVLLYLVLYNPGSTLVVLFHHIMLIWFAYFLWWYIWAATRENLSSVIPTKPDSNQYPQLQRLARKLKFHLY